MARRVRKQARRSGGGIPFWVWLLGGLLIGFVLFAMVFLRDRLPSAGDRPVPRPDASAPATREPPLAQDAEPASKRRYDFYTLLPEREVEISDEQLREQARAERERPTAAPPPPDGDGRFLLQAGSFTEPARADELKARIALAGEVARIETAVIQDTTHHRVILGPYPSVQALEAAKSRLAGLGIASMAVRAR